jgi:hypothetical protein
MIRIKINAEVPLPEIASALFQAAEQFQNDEYPDRLRDHMGNSIGWVEYDHRKSDEAEVSVTFIAGELYRWSGFPGSWEPFKPEAGQLMRMRR